MKVKNRLYTYKHVWYLQSNEDVYSIYTSESVIANEELHYKIIALDDDIDIKATISSLKENPEIMLEILREKEKSLK